MFFHWMSFLALSTILSWRRLETRNSFFCSFYILEWMKLTISPTIPFSLLTQVYWIYIWQLIGDCDSVIFPSFQANTVLWRKDCKYLSKYQIRGIPKVAKTHVKYVNWGSGFNFVLLTSSGKAKYNDPFKISSSGHPNCIHNNP